MFSGTIAVLGGDLRQSHLAEYLSGQGHEVHYHAKPNAKLLKEAVKGSSMIIGPTPFFKEAEPLAMLLDCLESGQLLAGGGMPESFVASCKERQVITMDFLEDPDLALANAALTAEGLLSILIKETPFSLRGRKALLLGFGRCGKEIGTLLQVFDMEVLVVDRDEACRKSASKMGYGLASLEELEDCPWDFDLIINTVPAQLLRPAQLKRLPKDCVSFEIASLPYGFDPALMEDLQLKLVNCPGIPGRYMPKTAGTLLGETMIERMSSVKD